MVVLMRVVALTFTTWLVPRDAYVASDVNPHYLAYLRNMALGKPYLEVDRIDLEDPSCFAPWRGKFDTVICLNVLEHVRDAKVALANMRDALQLGGRLLLYVPQGPGLYSSLDEVLGHRCRYSRAALTAELAAARAQLGEGLQKVHSILVEQAAGLQEKLAALPSTEQIHAFVEGGTANGIQSTRRMLADEGQRSQTHAERVTKKLDFLQSRSVIPLTAQGLVLCRNPLGYLAVPADDLATIGSLADGVLPDPGTLKVVERYLKAGGTFVDVGASVGVYTLLASRVVGASGKVVAIEPAPATARALKATVSANGLGSVVSVKEVAAGAEQGLGTLTLGQNSSHGTLLPSEGSGGTVVAPIVALDDVLADTIPDMIKIDVEGWEPNVIEGLKGTLRGNPNVILIMDFEPAHIRRTGLSAAAWVDRLVGAGLKIFEIDERNGELAPLRRNGLEEIVSINVVIARNDPSKREAESPAEDWLRARGAS